MKKVCYPILAALIPFVLFAQSSEEVVPSLNDCATGNISADCQTSRGSDFKYFTPENFAPNGTNDKTKGAGTTFKLTVFFEGPFVDNEMTTDLNENGQIPLSQPFTEQPFNWPGTEAVDSIPNEDIVDWVLVDMRDATDPELATYPTTCGRKAGFLLKNGQVVDLDGVSPIFVPGSGL